MARRLTAVLAGCVLAFAARDVRAAVPAWLQQVASAAQGPSARAAATVLLDQVDVTVAPDGKVRTSRRYAVRVNDRSGRDAAMVREVYISGTGRVRELRGWLLRRAGDVRELGGASTVDAALVNNDVYNEVRVRALSAIDDVAEGDVFGVEVDSEDRLLFAQFDWQLQDGWPVVLARRTLTLPAGWRARAVTFNASPIASRSQGQTTIWEASDLPEIPDERWMPPISSLAPRLVTSIFGSRGTEPPGQFDTWQDAAVWLDGLSAPDGLSADVIIAKARELTANARTEFERIVAIGRYVQSVQYVSIQTGIGRGGGYQPRAPALVLERNYGDCKDKASLMRALLAATGTRAYLVSIFSGDREYVRADWPSPQQFNHAIVAIAVDESMARGATSIIEHPSLGRLLVFDPTDEFTPVGELPATEQGSLALVISPQTDRLERMPMAPRGYDRLTRSIEGTLEAGGALSARVTERSRGVRAADERAAAKMLEAATYREVIQRQLAAAMPAARVTNVVTETVSEPGEFALTIDVTASAFAQPMGNLLLVKLPFGVGDPPPQPQASARRTPMAVQPRFVDESLRLQIPAAFTVDELPQPVMIDSPFGRYTLTYTKERDRLLAHRVLEVPPQTIAVSEYGGLVQFLAQVRAADTTPVVLAR